MDNDDLRGSLENLTLRLFTLLKITDPTIKLNLEIAIFPESIIEHFTRHSRRNADFSDFTDFIKKCDFLPTYSIHHTFENVTTFAQITARVKKDMECPNHELTKFFFIQRVPAPLRPKLREHL